jgi:hypothetical protein
VQHAPAHASRPAQHDADGHVRSAVERCLCRGEARLARDDRARSRIRDGDLPASLCVRVADGARPPRVLEEQVHVRDRTIAFVHAQNVKRGDGFGAACDCARPLWETACALQRDGDEGLRLRYRRTVRCRCERPCRSAGPGRIRDEQGRRADEHPARTTKGGRDAPDPVSCRPHGRCPVPFRRPCRRRLASGARCQRGSLAEVGRHSWRHVVTAPRTPRYSRVGPHAAL